MSKEIKDYKFHQTEDSKAGQFYIHVMYEGGDADTEHPEEYKLDGITNSNYLKPENLERIKEEVERYRILEGILNVHGEHPDYDEVLDEHGEEIADMMDNVPNDPQGDYQFKCTLDAVKLVRYDSDGNRFETYNILR